MAEDPFCAGIEITDDPEAIRGNDGVARGFRDRAVARFAETDKLLGLAAMDLMPGKSKRNDTEQREKPGRRDRKVELELSGLGIGV